MNKIIFLFILLVVPAPLVDAHPDPNSAMLMQNGTEIKNVEFIGLLDKEEEEVEFLSEEWFWKNFILLLSGLIAAIIVVTGVIVYREEV